MDILEACGASDLGSNPSSGVVRQGIWIGASEDESPWCSPELVGILRIDDDHTRVSQQVVSTLDSFTSWTCPPAIPTTLYSTSSFGYIYYADVPDNLSSVSLRATAWAINSGRGDDILVDQFVTYTLNAGMWSWTLWNGNSYYSFDVWTVALPKAKTVIVTDGKATITLANGQNRLVGQDRYYVFTFDVTSAYGPFVVGLNAAGVMTSLTTILIKASLPRQLQSLGLTDSMGLMVAIAGLLVSLIWTDDLRAAVGLAFAATGFVLTLGTDNLDRIPINPLRKIEETVGRLSIGHAGANLARSLST